MLCYRMNNQNFNLNTNIKRMNNGQQTRKSKQPNKKYLTAVRGLFDENKHLKKELITLKQEKKELTKSLKEEKKKITKQNKELQKQIQQQKRELQSKIKENQIYKDREFKRKEKQTASRIYNERISNNTTIEDQVLNNYNETEEQIENDLVVNYKAVFKDYKNIRCTKYTFTNVENKNDIDLYKTIEADRNKAILHFMKKHNIKIKPNMKLYQNITSNYFIGERILTEITDEGSNTFVKTLLLTEFYNMKQGYAKSCLPLEYHIYIIPKTKTEGGCDVQEHKKLFIDSEDEDTQNTLYCKSLKSSNNNCAIAMFTNTLKIKVQPNTLRKHLGLELNTFISVEQLDLLVDYFKCDITLYALKDKFEIIKNTNKYDNKFEAFIYDNHYWLVVKHSMKKNYGICQECGQERNNNGHKCSIDVIRKNKIKSIETNSYLSWNDQLIKVIENMKCKKNIIILGGGGVGKTFMIQQLNKHFIIINTASTGTASVNIKGSTIDSLLKLNQDKSHLLKFNKSLKTFILSDEKLEECEYIVIDEISMIDGKKFDDIINRLKFINKYRQNKIDINLIICGDALQLPPIETTTGYFFNSAEYADFEAQSYVCKLREVKRQNNKNFIELLSRVRFAMHTKEDVEFIKSMKNNNVDENKCIYMCAKNKDVNEINKKYFEENKNVAISFKRKIKYYMNKNEIDNLPQTNSIIEKVLKRGDDIELKLDMKVMITENIDVENGICNGTVGIITGIYNDYVQVKTEEEKVINISYFKVDEQKIKFDDYDENLKNHYCIINEFIPLKQCNAITIHKCQGMTLTKCILNCDGIFEKSMFYTALSRIIDPNNMKVINFKESYIKCNTSAFEYETEGKYISYHEKMLIDNDEDKLNTLKIKPNDNILEDNTIIYDFECATDGKDGHKPYFNHMIKLYKGLIDEEKTFCHYVNSKNVNEDTFEYVMKIITYQCDKYLEGKENDDKALIKEFKKPLYLCGFNSANYDLYFFTNLLLKSKYASRFISKTIFKSGSLVFFMLVDSKTGKIALKSHDLYQIVLSSLDDACKSYLNKDCKGVFPHKLINNIFFKDKDILDKTLKLKIDDFYKRDHEKLNEINLESYNIGEHLFKYAKNDTLITLELYRALNNLCHKYLKTDILRMLTVGMMANYGFMMNLPNECLYKTKDGNKRNNVDTRLYLCDAKENKIISESVYGGRALPRTHHYISPDNSKSYDEINDYLSMFDICGMYCDIMKENEFPYDKSRYATKPELDKYNELIKDKKYEELLLTLPKFYICECDCQPNEYDLEPPIGRHENNRLIWDCTRRVGHYNSIDVQLLIKNRGDIFEIKRMLIWDKSSKVFRNWMIKCLEIKAEGERLNNIEKGLGEAIRAFGKLLANASYGQTIKKDHDSIIQFINNNNDRHKYMDENTLSDIIFNDEDENGYHVFIGKRISDETKDLSSRSRFLGSFVLSYSRLMLDNIVNCIYGENRFNEAGIKTQIFLGDTDSLIIHSSLIHKLKEDGFLGTDSGKLSDDLNKSFLKNGFAKITKFVSSQPKKYALKYILPDNTIKEKIKCNGVNQKNMQFIDPFTGKQTTKLTYDIFEYMYLNSVNNSFKGYKFNMPDRLKKINIKRTQKEKLDKIPMFSVHCASLDRTLFGSEWTGRKMFAFPYTVPHGSSYCKS